ncbi:MAG TPA: DUF2326 domain-containing protein [Actinocatenispora sp.]
MLRELASDLPGFRSVRFAPGLNIAVVDGSGDEPESSPGPRHALPESEQSVIPVRPYATVGFTPLGEQWARERAAEAAASEDGGRHTARRTRLVAALDFALGGSAAPRHPGRRQELSESSTTVRLTGAGETVTATRDGTAPSTLTVHSSGTDSPPWSLPAAEWCDWLGRTLFGLTDTEDEPSYRSLMRYYVRDADHGGLTDPIRHHVKQPAVESLPPLAHLFGLDPALVEAAKTLHQSRRHLRNSQRTDGDLPSGQRLSDPSASRDLANLTAEIATLELERAEAAADASWRSARVAGGGLAADPAVATAALDARLAELKSRRAALARYADAHAELQRQALELRDSVRSDLRGRHDRLTAASNLFTRFAYEMFGPGRPAALTVAARDSGYAFYPVLGGDPAPGVTAMTLFCFDLAMAVTAHRAGTGPDFLVHDSALYEGVPTEFTAAALDLASRICAVEDMQYVAVLGRDQLTAVAAYDSALSYHECTVLSEV